MEGYSNWDVCPAIGGYWNGGVVLCTGRDVRGTYTPPFVLVVAPCGLCEAVWSAPVVGRAKSRPCNGLPQARGVVVCYASCEVGGCVLCLVRGRWLCYASCEVCGGVFRLVQGVWPLLLSSSRCWRFRPALGTVCVYVSGECPLQLLPILPFPYLRGVKGACMQVTPTRPPRLLNIKTITLWIMNRGK